MHEYRPSGFFVLRSPLLPLETYFELLGAPSARPAELEALSAALVADIRAIRARLAGFARESHVQEALGLASPTLHEALISEREGDEVTTKLDLALFRYVTRMCTRATPFGLFAGISVGELGGRTQLKLAPRATYRRHFRLDTQVICVLLDALVSEPDSRAALQFVVAPSLYQVAGRLRYAQVSLTKLDIAYPLVDVEPTPALLLLLKAAERRAYPRELAAVLRNAYGHLSERDAAAFVDSLIDHEILIPALTPQVTGPEPAEPLVRAWREDAAIASRVYGLVRAVEALGEAAKTVPGDALSHCAHAAEALDAVVGLPKSPVRFQVDMVKPLEGARLGRRPVLELLRVATLLAEHASAAQSRPHLIRFRERFAARYGQREVTLVEALDEDAGLAWGEMETQGDVALLHELPIASRGRDVRASGNWTSRDAFLARKLQGALREGSDTIEVKEGEFVREGARPQMPDAFTAMATLIARDGGAVDSGHFELDSPMIMGPSGIGILGRFCHADPALAEHVRAHLAREDALAGDVVLADIVHLSPGRQANVLLRPQLRAYEIVCNGRSGAPPDRQIPVTDLLVSVRGAQMILRSRKLGKRVLPRLLSAHEAASETTSPVYRFLCALQREEGSLFGAWDWGVFRDSEYLPRVRSGRTVLAPAMWNLSPARTEAILCARGAQRFLEVARLREALRIPRWIAVASHDQVLPLDLDNALCVEELAAQAAQAKQQHELLRLREFRMAGEGGGSPVTSAEGHFMHELVVPFLRAHEGAETEEEGKGAPEAILQSVQNAYADVRAIERMSTPGSDVLYAKLHAGASSEDAVLLEIVRPVLARAKAGGAVKRWFFVRHDEGGEHLRIRLFGPPARLWAQTLPDLHRTLAPFLASGRIWKLELGTYDREIERYGGLAGVALAEELFHADSEACMALVNRLAAHEAPHDRWRMVALGWDALLTDFGYDLAARRAFTEKAARRWAEELDADKDVHHALGRKARELMKDLAPLLDRGPVPAAPHEKKRSWDDVRHVFASRSEAVRKVVAKLDAARAQGMVGASRDELVWSFLHTHANRMFPISARAQEFVVHDFLARAYRSALARGESGSSIAVVGIRSKARTAVGEVAARSATNIVTG